MTVLVVGATGMLGQDMMGALGKAVGMGSADLDICDLAQVRSRLTEISGLSAVVNCAAYTAVDLAESETDSAMAINSEGVGNLAEVCAELGVPLVHFSTDYVFDGSKAEAYVESDLTCPINAYGASKLAGEQAVMARCSDYYIFRVQWLYGQHGTHFIKTMQRLAADRDHLQVVDDQVGAPTWTRDLATVVTTILADKTLPFGLYHMTPSGATSWYGFAQAFLSDITLEPVASTQFKTAAKRPHNSRLNCDKLGAMYQMRPWQDALQEFLCLD